MVTPMIPRARYDLYVASDVSDGGIYHFEIDAAGNAVLLDHTALYRPQYMTIEDSKLYVTIRESHSSEWGCVQVFSLSKEGTVEKKQERWSSRGHVPCHLCIENGTVYVANYLSGSVLKCPDRLIRHSGSSVHPIRQTSAHPHFVGITPDRRYVYVVDLGLDQIILYNKDLEKTSSIALPAGCGPRHLVFDDSGTHVFCLTELESDIYILDYSDGKLVLRGRIASVSGDTTGNAPGAIKRQGEYILASNRGRNCLSSFQWLNEMLIAVDEAETGGDSPRDFDFLDHLVVCGNQNSDLVTVFCLDDGKFTKLSATLSVPKPVCVLLRRKT